METAESEGPVLEFRCRHAFGDRFTLDAAFTARRRITFLFGPSGSGKTTVLAVIAGILTPQSARISVGGRTLIDTDARIRLPARRRRIGYVFQDHLLFPHLSVEKNLRFGERSPARISFSAVVEVLELTSMLRSRPDQLSGGQRQRVALGRALLASPDVLLMDEPLASLDEELKFKILSYLEKVVAEFRLPTLYVSHSQAEVRRLSDWVVVLERGRVLAEGPADDVLTQSAALSFREPFGPVNLLRLESVVYVDGRWIGKSGAMQIVLPAAPADGGRPVFVEFFPSDVLLGRSDSTDISARNHFSGVVAKIQAFPGVVLVAVDVGLSIWAEVTADAVREMGLVVGADVFCFVKTQRLRMLQN